MHVEKDPETIFPGEQEDFSNCSNVGKLTFLLFAVEMRLQDLIKESLKNNPLLKKIADHKLCPIIYR
jgi:hypothetical protein